MIDTTPQLPYSRGALAPVLSQAQVTAHVDGHHQGYLDTLANLGKQDPVRAQWSLAELVTRVNPPHPASALDPWRVPANQAWNHDFFWGSLCPVAQSADMLTGTGAHLVTAQFGGVPQFAAQVVACSKTVVGSGWIWLVFDRSVQNILLTVTKDAETIWPQHSQYVPLWVVDCWEHSFYLDYKSKKADYLTAIVTKLTNWDQLAARSVAHQTLAGHLLTTLAHSQDS